ncbi:condensation domain-containing protein [Rhodococcus sp. 3Y1]
MVTEVLDGATYDALSALARSHGVTVFMVVHSVIAVLLARECVTDDVVVGAAVSLRNDPALLSVAGMMVGTVALRTGSTPPIASLLFWTRFAASIWKQWRTRTSHSTTSLRRSIRRAG